MQHKGQSHDKFLMKRALLEVLFHKVGVESEPPGLFINKPALLEKDPRYCHSGCLDGPVEVGRLGSNPPYKDWWWQATP